jgi:hypothetical protein
MIDRQKCRDISLQVALLSSRLARGVVSRDFLLSPPLLLCVVETLEAICEIRTGKSVTS